MKVLAPPTRPSLNSIRFQSWWLSCARPFAYVQARSYRCRSRSASSSVKSRHCWGFRTPSAAVVIINIARQWVAPYTVTRNPFLGQSGCCARSSWIIPASSAAVLSSFRETRGLDNVGGLCDSGSTGVVIGDGLGGMTSVAACDLANAKASSAMRRWLLVSSSPVSWPATFMCLTILSRYFPNATV